MVAAAVAHEDESCSSIRSEGTPERLSRTRVRARVAGDESPSGRESELGQSAFQHARPRLPAHTLFCQGMRAIVDLRNPHPVGRELLQHGLVDGYELVDCEVTQADSLLVGDNRQPQPQRLQAGQRLRRAGHQFHPSRLMQERDALNDGAISINQHDTSRRGYGRPLGFGMECEQCGALERLRRGRVEPHFDHDGFSTPRFQCFRRAQLGCVVVAALDVEVRSDLLNQWQRPGMVEQRNGIDASQAADHANALILRVDGAQGAFVLPDRSIRVHRHNQRVAQPPRLFQIIDVASVQQVECAARESDAEACRSLFVTPGCQVTRLNVVRHLNHCRRPADSFRHERQRRHRHGNARAGARPPLSPPQSPKQVRRYRPRPERCWRSLRPSTRRSAGR